jgi:hypothetical protein
MMYGPDGMRKSRKERIRRKVLKKRIKEFQAEREYNNVSELVNQTKQEERNRIVQALDKNVDHSRVDCGINCIAHKQIQFIRDLKD